MVRETLMAQRTVPIDPGRAALILVDIQPDFMPGGALPVGEGNRILEPVRSLMGTGAFGTLVATQDWHPPGHISFASSHNGRRPFETLDLHGYEQTLWPDHCVKGTPGAALHPHLPWERVSLILRKGTDPGIDSYSGFRENRGISGSGAPGISFCAGWRGMCVSDGPRRTGPTKDSGFSSCGI
jgi:nicotinamidase/pyrazinamidase